MTTFVENDANRIRSNVERIRGIVAANDGRNVLTGLDAMLDRLAAGDLAEARNLFSTLLQKKGLLGDFHVADGSRDAPLLNEELSALLDETWALLEGV